MNALITSISTPFEGIFPIPELGLFGILLIVGTIVSLHTILTNDKE